MYLWAVTGGRLAGEMRWRVATLIAMLGIAAIPAVSDAAQPGHAAMLTVAVQPSAGSARTHFAVSFPVTVPSHQLPCRGSSFACNRLPLRDGGSSTTARRPQLV